MLSDYEVRIQRLEQLLAEILRQLEQIKALNGLNAQGVTQIRGNAGVSG